MTIGDLIQNIAAGGAVFLGITYVIGGLIVNLNLSRRGVVEYQVLKVKYLAVGIIFLFHFIGVVVITSVPAFLIFVYVRDFSLFSLPVSFPCLDPWLSCTSGLATRQTPAHA